MRAIFNVEIAKAVCLHVANVHVHVVDAVWVGFGVFYLETSVQDEGMWGGGGGGEGGNSIICVWGGGVIA